MVLLLIPLVNGSRPSVGHRNLHAAESVRLLQANETVHASGSDFVFSWAKCVICDGYDARLYLQDISGTRLIPHQLKSAVTSLKITNVPPRTVYRFVMKRLPSDIYSSEVSGRSFSQEAPLPVENLVARVLTSTSIQAEWTSQNADGFVARILENGTVVQEKTIPDFSNHSVVNITNLTPGTDYRVEVSAFYFPPAGNSISSVSSAQIRTLPVDLPDIKLTWKFNSDLELFWSNPDSPAPVMHKLNCTNSSRTVFSARLGGRNDFVAVSNVSNAAEIDCVLETWFSVDQYAKVVSRITAMKPAKTQDDSPSSDSFYCPNYGTYSITSSVQHKVEQINGMEVLLVSFSEKHRDFYTFLEASSSETSSVELPPKSKNVVLRGLRS